MSRLSAVVACAIFVSGSSLEAQDSAATLARMELRLDALRHLAVAVDITTDTAVAGGIRIATSAALLPYVTPAAADAWNRVLSTFGPAVAGQSPLPLQQFGGPGVGAPKHLDLRLLAAAFEAAAARAIWARQDSVLVRWLEGSYPIAPLSPMLLEQIHEDLVRMPALPNQACLAGDAGACAAVLGLRSGTDLLEAWYPSAAWPRLAQLANGPRSTADTLCFKHQEREACRKILLAGRIPPPVGTVGRLALVQLALDSGGAGAFGRLTADSGASIETRLAAAAGVPIESLLVGWASAVRVSVPDRPTPTVWMFLLVLGWCSAILAVSMGEGRWR